MLLSNQYILSEDLEIFGCHLIIFFIAARSSLNKTWNTVINNKNTIKCVYVVHNRNTYIWDEKLLKMTIFNHVISA